MATSFFSAPALAPALALALFACASGGAEGARANLVAAQRLRCEPNEMNAELERETPVVREWITGCNFTYTRVHCTKSGCYQAPPKPPCMDNMPCLVEDPMTLQWVTPVPGSHAQR
jgi:hypothetical protein